MNKDITNIAARIEKMLPAIRDENKYVADIKKMFFEDLECLIRLINKEKKHE